VYINAYAEVGDFDTVARLWEVKIEQEPDNLEAHRALAVAYTYIGEFQQAIAVIEELIEIQPEFREQGEEYVRELRAGRNPF
jgi:tetratricopeptide (TPR) repeat protein